MVTVLNSIESGHEDMVHDAELDYYGLRLATCSSDGGVRVFAVSAKGQGQGAGLGQGQGQQPPAHGHGQQRLCAELKGHGGPVWQVGWSHPRHGDLLASCSYDRKVIIWREGSGHEWTKAYEYQGHESSVNSIAWACPAVSPAPLLCCASSDGSISVVKFCSESNAWSADKIPGAHAVGCTAVSWCPADALSDKCRPLKRIVSGGCDNLVKIWVEDGDRWVEEKRLEVHTDWIRDVAWAPSVGLPRSVIATCSQDKRVVILTSDDNVSWNSTVLHTFDDVVWSVSWSLTGNVLAVSGGDNKVSLWRENNEGQWSCISEVARGIGNVDIDEEGGID